MNYLVSNRSTVNLNFEDVILLLSEVKLAHVGVCNNSDDGAVLFDSSKENILSLLVEVLLVMSESSLLGIGPVLVESLLGVLIDGLGPDSCQCSQTSWGIDVSDDTNNGHGGTFDDGDSFNNLLLVVS